jgi:F0F1-type ATP synthase assembly protein I
VKDEYKAIGSFSTLGIELVLCVLVGFFGGRKLDAHFATTPYLSLVGLAFGVGASTKALRRALREMKAITAREEQEQGNPPAAFVAPSSARPQSRADKEPDAGQPGRRP